MKTKLTDVVMLCYNPNEKTYRAIKSLLENTENINLIIVRAKQDCAKNKNEWLKRDLTDPFVICDDDIVVQPNWLPTLKKHLKKGIGIVGCKMLRMDNNMVLIPQNTTDGEVPLLNGGLCLFKNIGVIDDEGYVGSQYEDTDICYQYKDKGYKLWSTHDTFFYHDSTGQRANNTDNADYFFRKWGEHV